MAHFIPYPYWQMLVLHGCSIYLLLHIYAQFSSSASGIGIRTLNIGSTVNWSANCATQTDLSTQAYSTMLDTAKC
jgi:hypothetical protein